LPEDLLDRFSFGNLWFIVRAKMKRILFIVTFILISFAGAAVWIKFKGIDLGWDQSETRFKLYNGWFLSPEGKRISLVGDTPGPICLSEDSRYAIVGTSGYNDHSLTVLDLQTGQITDSQIVSRSSFGLAIKGSTVYSSGGRSEGRTEDIRKWSLINGKLTLIGSLTLKTIPANDRFVTSIAFAGDDLIVANAQSNEILRLSEDGEVLASAKVGYRPRMIVVSPDFKTIAVSEWGDSGVVLLDSQTLTRKNRHITLPHPTALVYHPDGRLFVAESGSNTITQIKGDKISRVTVSIDRKHRIGPTPTDLALSKDSNRLFVSLAGENAVAVVDVKSDRPTVEGHIPTERWPSSVKVSPKGDQLLIATSKGFFGPSAENGVAKLGADSAKRQMKARVAIVDMPNKAELEALTKRAKMTLPEGIRGTYLTQSQIDEAMQNLKKIKHVIYVIKENKSYDQVFGDIPGANGDPSLTLFGEKITPNQHALAKQFAIFDNLYCDGESSQVGHQWSTAAYANEYTETQWTSNYGDKGELTSDKRLTSSPGEYLWSQARKKKISARVYGEYVDVQEGHGSLEDEQIRANPEKWGYSEAWERVFAKDGRDTEKLSTFLAELKEYEKSGNMPALMVMALPDDHTHGYRAGEYTPKAMIMNNDYAVGQLVEAISKSKFWKDTAIFVIQDDTQGSLDHVESHRTYGLVLSPWTQKGIVDSTQYSTASMLRTMEIILGLPPMSSYDANATPMLTPFLGKPIQIGFAAIWPGEEMNRRNPAKTELSRRTEELNWTDIDLADPAKLGRLLWDGERPGHPYPKILK
jgi:DNA-binding beta-propeller fold protein YncE